MENKEEIILLKTFDNGLKHLIYLEDQLRKVGANEIEAVLPLTFAGLVAVEILRPVMEFYSNKDTEHKEIIQMFLENKSCIHLTNDALKAKKKHGI